MPSIIDQPYVEPKGWKLPFFEPTEEGDLVVTDDSFENPGRGWRVHDGDLVPAMDPFTGSSYFQVDGPNLIIL